MRIILVGFGFLGKELVGAISRKLELLKEIDREFKLVGVSDIDGYAYDDKGLDLQKLCSLQRISDHPTFSKGKSSVELIEKSNANIMVEATITNIKNGEPGLTHIRSAINRGINVVTSNKGPIVLAFAELMKLTEKNSCVLKYEATVAGAIPVFSLIKGCLQGDKILKISGILNGTTNYILSKMYLEEMNFEIALKEAQERGIAEKDPTYDIESIDAACKVVILANALMKRNVRFEDVKRVGVARITPEAISLAKQSGYTIKSISTVDKTLEVAPKLIPTNHPLCVHGALNALHIETDLAKEITIFGYGAGRETVSATLNDIISLMKNT